MVSYLSDFRFAVGQQLLHALDDDKLSAQLFQLVSAPRRTARENERRAIIHDLSIGDVIESVFLLPERQVSYKRTTPGPNQGVSIG